MITAENAIKMHNRLIENFGGSKGIRDKGALDSALNRPYATFDQQDLYPTPIDKGAAILESLVINHPFIDGNKRIAYTLMRLTLRMNGVDIKATEEEKYKLVIAASKSEMKFEAIKMWLEIHQVAL